MPAPAINDLAARLRIVRPLCPDHRAGTRPMAVSDRAVWWCTPGPLRANRCADDRPADPYGPQDMLPRHTVPTAGGRPVRRYVSTASVTQRFSGYVPWPSSSAVRSTPTPSPRARAM